MSLKIANIKIPLIAGAITLLAVAVMVKLGFWQLDRAAEKDALFSDYQQQANEVPASQVTDLGLLKRRPERFEAVQIRGQFDPLRYFLIDNQLRQGQPGYHVVGLFNPTNMSPLIPVNLGWIKAPTLRSEFPDITIPENVLTLTGLAKFPQENVFINKVKEQNIGIWPKRVPQFIPNKIADDYQLSLTPYLLLLSQDHSFGYTREWQPTVMPPEKHQAYALQWFTLAIAALVIFTFAVIKVNKSKKEE